VRLIVARSYDDGRSYAADVQVLTTEPASDIDISVLAATGTVPPVAMPAAVGAFMDNSPPPGILQWKLARFPPGHRYPTHFTDSIDFHTVVSGSITLGLADGSYPLLAGDCAVVVGVDHDWAVGPEGCAMLMMRVGTASRRDGPCAPS
jgi:hypothetical protein